jgi:L-lactate dehydrogenase complex protein LldG
VSAARDEILARIRAAMSDAPDDERPIPRGYRRQGDRLESRLERFVDRIREYHADVRCLDAGHIGAAISKYCADMALRRVVVPSALPSDWRPAGVEVLEDRALTAAELDAVDAAVTGCAVAIAETGTLVLDGRDVSGRRAITLVPDHHVCVVRAEQVVGLVPEAVAAVDPRAPVTLISGPSASSDIELQRVEGLHGPRHLLVLVATE